MDLDRKKLLGIGNKEGESVQKRGFLKEILTKFELKITGKRMKK